MGGFGLVGSTAGGIEGSAGGFMDRSGRQGRARGFVLTGELVLVNMDPDQTGARKPLGVVMAGCRKNPAA